jgi:hypothetical protein
VRITGFLGAAIVLAALGCVGGTIANATARTAAPNSEGANLSAAFVPDRLGGRTTLEFAFTLEAPPGEVPSPLTQIELRYPANLGILLSHLGVEVCTADALEASGPRGCPPNSVMGYGVVRTGVRLGNTIITENAPITVFRAPTQEGLINLIFYAEGTQPVVTDIIFSGVLLPAPLPFGGRVSIGVPLVQTLPGAPYVSVFHLRATIGPRRVTYYEKVGGQVLAYKPAGIVLPPHCPSGGFPFAAAFTFSDGGGAFARTFAGCPPPSSDGSGGRRSPPSRRRRHRRRRPSARHGLSRLAG